MEQENTVNADTQMGEGSDQTVETSHEETISAAKYKELEDTNRQLFERAKKAEGFVKVDGKWVKAPKPEEAVRTQNELQAKTGELDETQLDYLDLKGISETEDIDIIQAVMKRTGQTVRQALKDEYVQTKLKANSEKRAVAAAMPSGTKRSGAGAGMGLEAAIAKYEQTGEYPSDFELRTQVVNAMVERSTTSNPPWRK
jgi:hypothetical protein